MTPEQKQAARNLIDDFKDAGNEWDEAAVASHMTALLQELVDAPEPEPVRWLIYHNEFLRAETSTKNEANGYQKQGFRVAPLYAAPPAPSVHVPPMENIALNEWLNKTEWVQKEINTFPVSSLGMHRADVMRMEIERLREMLAAAPTPAEAPEDVARDAGRYRWLRKENAKLGSGYYVGNDTNTMPGDITWIGSDLDAAIDAAIAAEKGGA